MRKLAPLSITHRFRHRTGDPLQLLIPFEQLHYAPPVAASLRPRDIAAVG